MDFSDINILIVDDSKIICRLFSSYVGKFFKSVDCVYNGQEALDIIESNIKYYGVIILDINMPVLDGLTTANKIRSYYGNMPIVFIIGENDTTSIRYNTNLISNSVLLFKPCSEKSLLNHICLLFDN